MKQLINVAISDLKLIFRDASLRVFLALPILPLLIIKMLVPYLMDKYEGVADYTPFILMWALTQTPTMFSFIYSMVFIDEKDTEVARVYGILPLSKTGFLLFRLSIPFCICTVVNLAILQLQPFYHLNFPLSFITLAIISLLMPILTVAVTILSKNKMDGMTWLKLFNLPILLPVLAFFLPKGWSYLFAFLPTHWFYQAMSSLIQGGSFLVGNLVIGATFCVVLVTLLTRRFVKVHYL